MTTTINPIDVAVNSAKLFVYNALPILGAVLLWMLTIWIPYINVGTTIAISVLPSQLARGEVINPLSIFDAKYRKYMGEFFLVLALMYPIILVGFLFMILPGLIMSVSYMYAPMLVLDRRVDASKAITMSNELTSNSKWMIMLSYIIIYIALAIVMLILSLVHEALVTLFMPFLVGMLLCAKGYIYKKLTHAS